MRHDFRFRQRQTEIQETAPHVIIGGNQPQRMEMFGPHPGRGFGGVADGVFGGIAEHDAALGLGRLEAGDPQQLADVDAVVDPGDEQLAPLALGEQLQPGGKALAVQCDVRFEESVQAMVDETVKTFGGIDVLVNNAGAISLTSIDDTPMKKFDLMMGINARGMYLCTKLCVPHLRKSSNAHVLSMSPPVSLDPNWMKGHAAYSLTKYGMTLLTMGLAEELRDDGIALNALWPRTVIWTAALDMLMGEAGEASSRTPEIMADAAYAIVTTEGLKLTGQALLDEKILRDRGVTDFEQYACKPGHELQLDLYVSE